MPNTILRLKAYIRNRAQSSGKEGPQRRTKVLFDPFSFKKKDECDKYIELISASLDGALSPAEAAELEAHLALCPSCRALARDLGAVHAAMASLPDAPPPPGLTDRIMTAVQADNVTPLPVRKRPSPWKRWAASAAVLALVLTGAWYAARNNRDGLFNAALPKAGDQAPEAFVDAADTAPENALPKDSAQYGFFQPRQSSVSEPTPALSLPVSGETKSAAPEPNPSGAAQSPQMEPASSPNGSTYGATADEGLTPAQAMDLLLESEGFEGGERVNEETVSWPREGCVQDNLVYIGLSENGKYHMFILSRLVYPSADAGTADHSSRCDTWAVALDGANILEETDPEFAELTGQ